MDHTRASTNLRGNGRKQTGDHEEDRVAERPQKQEGVKISEPMSCMSAQCS